ncbi:unnamed protein product [Acanthoscelides obtectus]|uniref:Zinc finger PHD-type domain-containing protein n=1 Tax=Acanthoscelides obtectus TaxID=200917 RepID=A0A9P0LCK9_ACAOB|nr:unnamed protein product [Acanthoscelides obtectus]CAK1630908.1 hypothetical protein AOBTE_LOCUS6632 [Acanthoscelides obtectus]
MDLELQKMDNVGEGDLDFVPSQVTAKEYDANKAQNLAASNGQSASPSSPIPSCSRHEAAEDTQRNDEHRTPPHSPISLCSLENENHGKENRSSPIPSCSFQSTYKNSNYFIPLTAIQPLPIVKQDDSKRKRRTQKSEILTSTPIREQLRNQKNKKLRAKKPSSSNLDRPKLQYPKPPVHKTDPNEENVPCLVCGDTFGNSRPGETWIECNMCQNWAHQLCADYNRAKTLAKGNDDNNYVSSLIQRERRKDFSFSGVKYSPLSHIIKSQKGGLTDIANQGGSFSEKC